MSTSAVPLADADARALIASALDATLIVEAAAGTGKTTELVRRIVRTIAEGHAGVGEIVAVTFTEKAAGELKLRLRERLDRERSDAQLDPLKRQHLDAALKGLEEAHVGTIHGFCADLLRERPIEAGIDPLFEVLTEPASARLFDEAFGRWLQQQLSNPAEGVRRALKRTAYGGADGPIDRIRRAGWELAQWRDFTGSWTREPFDRIGEIRQLVTALHEFADLTRSPRSSGDPLYTGTDAARRVSDEIALHQGFGDAADGPQWDEWEAALVDLSRDRSLANVRQGRGTAYSDRVPRERVLSALEDLRGRLDSFRMIADADLAALLQRELRGAIDRYEEMKSAAGALDFLDLLVKTRDVLRAHPAVRQGFQRRFKRIFVDEFQDTDPLQAEILLLLAADDDSETDWRRVHPVPGRLFLVGDPKQSIYRFRRADVGIYAEVCRQLQACGARLIHLTTSFRSVPGIQSLVNAAFEPVMNGNPVTLQAHYVPLMPDRTAFAEQPAVVALPVPEPYARRYVSAIAVERSLPDAVGAFVEWLVTDSGWKVTERSGTAPVPVAAKHVCLLFRRFVSFDTDVTRPYVDALEARGVPHVLVGGRAFHEREEIEAIRCALAAIEWPDDELSIFGTLRGPFFAIGDEELLEWTYRFGRHDESGFRRHMFHPFRVPAVFDGDIPPELDRLRPVATALRLLNFLHKRRNYVPVAETLHGLLGATRAHVGLALRPGGEQALANVLHVSELARQYELAGGISFRGFVEELRTEAEAAHAAEAPILEEDSDGVRMMTVHRAKGLEFPIVVLADLTCRLSRAEAGRWIDPERNLCALKLGGWAPLDLLRHDAEEAARDRAEGERLAYVAATRARDVLVVPTIGDEPYEGGWLSPLNAAVYPRGGVAPASGQPRGCPAFPSRDSVLNRPDGDPARPTTVAPGAYDFPVLPDPPIPRPAGKYQVVWWDPHVLPLGTQSPYGIRRDDLIAKDGDPAGVEGRLRAYRAWEEERTAVLARGATPSISCVTATDAAAAGLFAGDEPDIETIDLSRVAGRPFGPAFGTLVHATLATVALDADESCVRTTAATQARLLGAAEGEGFEEEVCAAAEAVSAALKHPLFARVREAAAGGRCDRELPIVWLSPEGALIEGTIDLAFDDGQTTTVVDFKTDREIGSDAARYRRQVAIYCRALAASRGGRVRGVLLRI